MFAVAALSLTSACAKSSSAASAKKKTPIVAASSCTKGKWPVEVTGRSKDLKDGGNAGVYLWFDLLGWHLRTATPPNTSKIFTGTVTSSEQIKLGAALKPQADDSVAASGHVINFTLDTHSSMAGFDFVPGCVSMLAFDFRDGGQPLGPTSIYLGPRDTAVVNPFTVARVSAAP